MKTKGFLIGITLAAVLAVALTLGFAGGFINTASAQGPDNGNTFAGTCHDNTAVLDLLKSSAADLQTQRQAGKSWLEIATAQGVTEQALVDAILKPVDSMHDWMEENYPQSNAEQMDEYMRDQVAKDIRESKFGTMTDRRLLGGFGGMMGNWTGNNGFGGMMGNWNGNNGFQGMMGNGNWFQGMMSNWNGFWGGMMGNGNNGFPGMMGNGYGANGYGGMMGGRGMMGNTQ